MPRRPAEIRNLYRGHHHREPKSLNSILSPLQFYRYFLQIHKVLRTGVHQPFQIYVLRSHYPSSVRFLWNRPPTAQMCSGGLKRTDYRNIQRRSQIGAAADQMTAAHRCP